eukprot:COSAG05_NODE_404_length_10192_cov_3.830377_4_plen_327_part_00
MQGTADEMQAAVAVIDAKTELFKLGDPVVVQEVKQELQKQQELQQLLRQEVAEAKEVARREHKERKRIEDQQLKALAIPSYWTNKNKPNTAGVHRFNTKFQVARIQDAMRQSAISGNLRGCRVHKVERVENMTLWKNYVRQKQALGEKLQNSMPVLLGGRPKLPLLQNCNRIIDPLLNELWLWHGTSPKTADILAKDGFDERVANLQGLYGGGSYFADASSKSAQYSKVTNRDGHYCMLYCRVTMGSAFRATGEMVGIRRPPPNPALSGGGGGGSSAQGRGVSGTPHDSILAESGVANNGRQGHNEYIVFHPGQAYPEFIVWFTPS